MFCNGYIILPTGYNSQGVSPSSEDITFSDGKSTAKIFSNIFYQEIASWYYSTEKWRFTLPKVFGIIGVGKRKMERKKVGTRLKQARVEMGWTQEETSDKAGINRVTYADYERNGIESVTRLIQLAVLFKKDVGWFFKGNDEEHLATIEIRISTLEKMYYELKSKADHLLEEIQGLKDKENSNSR